MTSGDASELNNGGDAARKRRRPGRPSLLTPETESRILNAIRCGAPNKVACAAAGVSEDTLYRWLQISRERPKSEYARFAEKLDRARQEGITARLAIIQKAAVKDWRAAAWLLERDLPEAFSLKFKVEHGIEPKALSFAEALIQLREDRQQKVIEGEAC